MAQHSCQQVFNLEIIKNLSYVLTYIFSCSWIAYDKENYSGNQYVLEEGAYPDLSAMGCLPQTCLKSLQVVNIVSYKKEFYSQVG